MDLEHKVQKGHFQVPDAVRAEVIEQNIIGPLRYLAKGYADTVGSITDKSSGAPIEDLDSLQVRVEATIGMYTGQDANVLSILTYATEKGRLTEFLTLLESQYTQGTVPFLIPEIRSYAEASNMRKSQEFFLWCYQQLGVEARTLMDYAPIDDVAKEYDGGVVTSAGVARVGATVRGGGIMPGSHAKLAPLSEA